MTNKKNNNAKNSTYQKEIKTYHSQNVSDFCVLLGVLCYAILFFLISLINDSIFLSFILSIFSFVTTLGFEILEWLKLNTKFMSSSLGKYTQKNPNSTLFISPFLFLVFSTPLAIYSKLDSKSYISFIQSMDSHLPNIIAALSFIMYFISFHIRNYIIKRRNFKNSISEEAK